MMKNLFPLLLSPGLLSISIAQNSVVPLEPVEIGGRVQFFVDDYIVDNRWSLKPKTEEVLRAFHAPVKHAGNPVVPGQGGYVNSAIDPDTGLVKTEEDRRGHRYLLSYRTSGSGMGRNGIRVIGSEDNIR